MDSRKLQFLQAVVGEDGARALSKAAERAIELDQAIFPRTIMSWLDVTAPFGYEGTVPGVDVSFNFKKSEKGYEGSIAVNGELHRFRDMSIDHVAGCVAVALGLDHERVSAQANPGQIAKLGKSIDLLVKSHLVKTSWNVKARRRFLFDEGASQPVKLPNGTPVQLSHSQASARRAQYARSIGLKPERAIVTGFPQSEGGTHLPYNNSFPVEHETAHAMMTPPGRTLSDYQSDLSGTDSPKQGRGDIESEDFQRHAIGTQQENIANQLENYIDRRSGVDPHVFASQYREPVAPSGVPVRLKPEYPVHDPQLRKQPEAQQTFAKPIRDDAKLYAQRFDEGARFTPEGKVAPPSGIDAKINARAKAKLPMTKADVKPNKKIRLPGTAAAPRPPLGPTPPTLVQPKNMKQAPAGAAGTAQTSPLPQMPTVSKKKATVQVTKSEAQKKCSHCARVQFNQNVFKGCFCFNALAKSVKTTQTAEGYTLEFGAAWDADAIATLVDTFRGK